MWKKQFCLGLNGACGMPFEEQLELLKNTGFDGFFVTWGPNVDLEGLTQKAKSLGLRFQSIHAPWDKSADMWHEDEDKAQLGVRELQNCVDACVCCGVDILVVHTFIGFEEHDPRPIGLTRFAQVVDYAREKGVKIAFENTEGEDYLQMLLKHFKGHPNVGFCWDTGHEMCYNHSQDLLALYGDQLLCTHLNDNLGIRDFDGQISVTDDLHLLPFEGVADWQDIVSRLKRCDYRGELTFELKMVSKHARKENARYEALGYEAFMTEAYMRACRVGYLLLRQN